MIKFTVNRIPEGQKRHRRGRGKGHFDPSKAGKDAFLALAYRHRPEKPIDFAIQLTVTFVMPLPKSHYGTGANAGKLKDSAPIYHISKPDIDNLIKFVFDALNGIFWKDDCVISKVEAAKMYGDPPRTVVEIKEL